MSLIRQPLKCLLIACIGLMAGYAQAAPESGWWWNAAEGGRGFTIEVQDGVMFMAGYMYDDEGNPNWYVSGPTAMVNANTYQGTWLKYGGGQTLNGAYRSPSVWNSNVGSVTLNFSSPTSGTLRLPNGNTIALSRFSFGPATGVSSACTPEHFTVGKYRSIALGMSLEQVKQIIGCEFTPALTAFDEDTIHYTWMATRPGTPTHIYSISVHFDQTSTRVQGQAIFPLGYKAAGGF